MNQINWKDVAARTAKTFVAAFIPAMAVDVAYGISDARGLAKGILAMLLSAASAGITAVWNMLLEMFRDQINAFIDKIFGRLPDGTQDDVSSVDDVELGSYCRDVELGSSCSDVELGSSCSDVELGSSCRDVELGSSCKDVEQDSNHCKEPDSEGLI